MSVRYTDGAKMLIAAIFVGTVTSILIPVFLFMMPEKGGATPYTPPEKKTFTCSEDDYIGYAHNNNIDERMKQLVEQRKFELYCIEKTGVRQWSIYAK